MFTAVALTDMHRDNRTEHVFMAQWANTLSKPQYLLGLTG